MAVSAITGNDGRVTVPLGLFAGKDSLSIYRWECEFSRDIFDTTAFSDATAHRTKTPGMFQATGTFESYYTGTIADISTTLTGANQAPVAGFSLTLDAGNSLVYTFSEVIVNNMNWEVPKAGLIILTFSFESSGAITQT